MSSPAKKFRVRDGRILHFPQEWCEDSAARVWIRSGQVVDLGDPEIAKLAAGQLYKLEPVEEGEMTWTIDQAPAPLRRHLNQVLLQRKKQEEEAVPRAPERKVKTTKKKGRRSRRAAEPQVEPEEGRAADFRSALKEIKEEIRDASLDSSEG
jgi:hypothetical protein